jgi:hypothetical protein
MPANHSTIHDAIQHSSSSMIQDSLIRISDQMFPNLRWLRNGNKYAKKTIDKLTKERQNAPMHPNELAEYIAVSSILHCTDGWSFFSNAVESLLNGDSSTSVFMAYYAQLRSVMSFFACDGIGIFNAKHFWYDGNGNCSFIIGKTHDFTRDLLNNWAIEPAKCIDLLNLMKIENRDFASWISNAQFFLGGPFVAGIAKEWLTTWSMDLEIIGKDHEIRNEASYRPQRIDNSNQSIQFEETIKVLIGIWKASEPLGENRFSLLDRHLLRLSISSIFKNKTGRNPRNNRQYDSLIHDMMINIGVAPDGYLNNFLTFNVDPDIHPVLMWAKKPGRLKNGCINPLPVISRSYLLLRLASAAVQDLLNKVGINSDELKFWWDSLGVDLGYWMPGDIPPNIVDLWVDIEPNIVNIQDWIAINQNSQSLNFRRELPFELIQLSQFNRVGLWGIGL